MRILIVEDEIKTGNYLRKGLQENGLAVDLADNGLDGLHFATTQHYDVIVLDVMLPKLDGWTVIQRIREQGQQTPILFLTARDDIEDRVKGFDLGADDYLIKPFAFSELLARLFALARRSQQLQSTTLSIADLEIDPMSYKARRAGKLIPLTAKEFSLLSLLLRNKGKPLSRTVIAERVWDMNFDSDTNVVDVAIKRLRSKIDNDFTQKLIHTVRGVGYVLEVR